MKTNKLNKIPVDFSNAEYYPIKIIPTMGFFRNFYKFLFINYSILKNNKNEFIQNFNWTADQYNKILYDNLLLCDITFLFITTPLRFSYEKAYYLLQADYVEKLYTYIKDEYTLSNNNTKNIIRYFTNLEDLNTGFSHFRFAYSKEIDRLIREEDQATKLSDNEYQENLLKNRKV